jgi:tetratricopeptide (TPR) repeat protein
MNISIDFRKRAFALGFLLLILINPKVACHAADTWQRRMDDAAFYLLQKQTQFAEQNYLAALNEAELSRNKPRLLLTAFQLAEFYYDAKSYTAAEKYYLKAGAIYPFEEADYDRLKSIYTKTGRSADLAKISRIEQAHKVKADTDYGPFLADLQESMRKVWVAKCKADPRVRSSPANDGTVKFIILKNKTLGACCINKSSGIRFMDQLAESCIVDASPFETLPNVQFECTYVEFAFRSIRHPNGEAPTTYLAEEKKTSAKVLKESTSFLGDKQPTLVFYTCEHARNCLKNKDFDEATALYRKAVKIVETNPAAANSAALAYVGLADCLFATGNPKEAEECYLSALSKTNPSNKVVLADLYHGYGHLLYKVDRSAEGDAIFTKEKALR